VCSAAHRALRGAASLTARRLPQSAALPGASNSSSGMDSDPVSARTTCTHARGGQLFPRLLGALA
jgi:hypothetical protein